MSEAHPSRGPLLDPRVLRVVDRLCAERRRPPSGNTREERERRDPHDFADYGFSIQPDQGDLIYLLCRALGARRVVDFASSVGMSTLYFAAAVRDNGGGLVIGSELVPQKADVARRNLAEAGLEEFVDLRVGDARKTLLDLGGPVDFALVDGWPGAGKPTLAREVLEIVAPQLRVGAVVMNDNAEEDYLDFVRDPARGFRSLSLPLKGATELSVKVATAAE
ncbi:class I SAM-dependent methyltransferase [Streptomyces sp. NPDC008150]